MNIVAPNTPAPFMKWAGGKTKLLGQLLPLLEGGGTYYEPFLGGGAAFFAKRATGWTDAAALSDANAELINVYAVIRDNVEGLIPVLSELEGTYLKSDDRAAAYYAVRAQAPTNWVPAAARTVFLNKTCFNGLYRCNKSGGFNVPHGRYKAPNICRVEQLRAASVALQGTTLYAADFREVLVMCQAGDVFYADPPYLPISKTASFTGYTAGGFGWTEQVALADVAAELRDKDVHIVLSNADHPDVRRLYGERGFTLTAVQAHRAISAAASSRGKVGELIITG